MHSKYIGAAGKALAIFLVVMSLEAAAAGEAPQERWVINTGEHGERDRLTSYPAWTRLVESLAGKARISSSFTFSVDSTTDMVATRNGTVAMIVGPAHMISSALRHGHYVPVGATSRNVRVVLATLKGSNIRSFADVKGKSLGLPGQDAIATYLMRGEANAAGSSIRQYFKSIYFTYYEGALLNALKFSTVDVAAVEETLFEQWQAKNEPVQEVMRTKEFPGIAIVAHKALGKGTIDTMREQLAGKAVPSQPGASFRPVEPAAYSYVSTLGYFTPRQLEGSQVVNAREARQLMARGVPLYDTRVRPEHVVSRPAGAQWLPYTELSAKETDFDPAKDQFDLAKLPSDKTQELIFACGGPECWKSYKAAVLAVRAGYKRIYWFRGGMTDWMEAGFPIDKG